MIRLFKEYLIKIMILIFEISDVDTYIFLKISNFIEIINIYLIKISIDLL